jgi:hypothetical protein
VIEIIHSPTAKGSSVEHNMVRRLFLLGLAMVVCVAPAQANSAFDVFGKVFKRPAAQPVNIRKGPSPNAPVLFTVFHGQALRVTGGSCVNAKTGAEIDITIYPTKATLYRRLSKPHVFCQVYFDDSGESGFMRGTHFMPNSGFN